MPVMVRLVMVASSLEVNEGERVPAVSTFMVFDTCANMPEVRLRNVKRSKSFFMLVV